MVWCRILTFKLGYALLCSLDTSVCLDYSGAVGFMAYYYDVDDLSVIYPLIVFKWHCFPVLMGVLSLILMR